MVNIQIGKNNNGTIAVAKDGGIIYFASKLDEFKEELERLKLDAKASENNKQAIEEALSAIVNKNENKFKEALKKAASFIRNVASDFTANCIVEYIKQNGF